MKGLLFNVKRYSIHDGPGVRVTFFLKGCPLSCLWCHNPEGISAIPEKVELFEKIGDKEFSRVEEAGRYYSVTEILGILEREKIFMTGSKGGVTFSGGEPMLQPEFLLEALKACKKNGYHTAIDTSGYSGIENFKKVIPYTDLFLFDLKHMDNKKHISYTGVPNSLIISNFIFLLKECKDIIVRIPVIPGLNDEPGDLEEMKHFLAQSKSNNLKKICLLPYHKTGTAKYKKFNIPNRLNAIKPPSDIRMNELKDFFSGTGIKVKIGG